MRRASVYAAVAIGAIAVAYALPMESVGCPQNSHYAAARAIAEGHPYIDRYAGTTCDLSHASNGHYYAAKGPLLDLWSAPWYLLLHAVGAVPHDKYAARGYLFYVLVAVAVACTAAATKAPLARRYLAGAAAVVPAWIVVEHAAPELLRVDRLVHQSWGLLAALLLVAAAALAAFHLRPEGLLLLPFATVRFDDHTKWALLLAFATVLVLATRIGGWPRSTGSTAPRASRTWSGRKRSSGH